MRNLQLMARKYKVMWRCNRCGRKHVSNAKPNKEPSQTPCKRCGYTGQDRETVKYWRDN